MRQAVMGMNDIILGSMAAFGLAIMGCVIALGMLLWEIEHSFSGEDE